jgi:hypothetical protein
VGCFGELRPHLFNGGDELTATPISLTKRQGGAKEGQLYLITELRALLCEHSVALITGKADNHHEHEQQGPEQHEEVVEDQGTSTLTGAENH